MEKPYLSLRRAEDIISDDRMSVDRPQNKYLVVILRYWQQTIQALINIPIKGGLEPK